jgi:hypothetical protein
MTKNNPTNSGSEIFVQLGLGDDDVRVHRGIQATVIRSTEEFLELEVLAP